MNRSTDGKLIKCRMNWLNRYWKDHTLVESSINDGIYCYIDSYIQVHTVIYIYRYILVHTSGAWHKRLSELPHSTMVTNHEWKGIYMCMQVVPVYWPTYISQTIIYSNMIRWTCIYLHILKLHSQKPLYTVILVNSDIVESDILWYTIDFYILVYTMISSLSWHKLGYTRTSHGIMT